MKTVSDIFGVLALICLGGTLIRMIHWVWITTKDIGAIFFIGFVIFAALCAFTDTSKLKE